MTVFRIQKMLLVLFLIPESLHLCVILSTYRILLLPVSFGEVDKFISS